MSAEQVLRAVLIKQLGGFSYEQLAFHLADSFCYRGFCRIGYDQRAPSSTTLQRNISRVRAETLEAVNRQLMLLAHRLKKENGRQVRTDCTVMATNIHAPADSDLLYDVVRTLTRMLGRVSQYIPVSYGNHNRRAKRRALQIQYAKTETDRRQWYRDLLKVSHQALGYAHEALAELEDGQNAEALNLQSELRYQVGLAQQVIDQTQRRVLDGQSVPATEKLFSIFEPHTDIIRKQKRETLYGHKLALSVGLSGLVLDATVEDGNPADCTLAVKMVQRLTELYAQPPRQVSFDGGFSSKSNLADIKRLGVTDVCFSKTGYLKVTDMVRSSWVYRRLRRFRAGVESIISFLKRCFGLSRCSWRGYGSFKAYTWSSLLSANLLVLARHTL